jgi:menaquinol-cytochrome c reductase iron-sulfur subunit
MLFVEVSMSDSGFSRRDFIKITTGVIGGIIGLGIGLPAIAYLLDPAFKSTAKDAWIPIGKLSDIQIGTPFQFSFTRVQVNGWERTSTSHGGYVIRKSDNPTDMLILNSRCTHLSCTVNWRPDAQAFICPCHDGKFGPDGKVLGGPPPRPLDAYKNFRVTQDGVLEIFYKAA